VPQQFGHEIPVHIKILVVVAAAMYSTDAVTNVLGIGREIAAIVLEMVRLEGDGAVAKVGIVQ
jgi:hypothetical protein